MRKRLLDWDPDPIRDDNSELLAFKHHGFCKASDKVGGECQIVPLLTTLFGEDEHVAIYKRAPNLKDVSSHPRMKECTDEVTRALRAFEEEFETLLEATRSAGSLVSPSSAPFDNLAAP